MNETGSPGHAEKDPRVLALAVPHLWQDCCTACSGARLRSGCGRGTGGRSTHAPMSLTQHIGHFSSSLRNFSVHVSGGVDELRQCANSRACNGRAFPKPTPTQRVWT